MAPRRSRAPPPHRLRSSDSLYEPLSAVSPPLAPPGAVANIVANATAEASLNVDPHDKTRDSDGGSDCENESATNAPYAAANDAGSLPRYSSPLLSAPLLLAESTSAVSVPAAPPQLHYTAEPRDTSAVEEHGSRSLYSAPSGLPASRAANPPVGDSAAAASGGRLALPRIAELRTATLPPASDSSSGAAGAGRRSDSDDSGRSDDDGSLTSAGGSVAELRPVFLLGYSNLEDSPSEPPPSYEYALNDSSPPGYIDNTFYTDEDLEDSAANPSGIETEVLIDGLPVGAAFSFVFAFLASFIFQFVGFVFTFLLSMSHAGRNGAKAGLGATSMQMGFYLRARVLELRGVRYYSTEGVEYPSDPEFRHIRGEKNLIFIELSSYFLLIIGWFFIVKSVAEYLKLRRLEKIIKANPEAYLP